MVDASLNQYVLQGLRVGGRVRPKQCSNFGLKIRRDVVFIQVGPLIFETQSFLPFPRQQCQVTMNTPMIQTNMD